MMTVGEFEALAPKAEEQVVQLIGDTLVLFVKRRLLLRDTGKELC